MNIKNIVADLEYCKELKELGLSQKSLFYWVQKQNPIEKYRKDPFVAVVDCPQINFDDQYLKYGSHTNAWYIEGFNDECADNVESYISAWTASELGEMFGASLEIKRYDVNGFSWDCEYGPELETDKKMANSIAKQLIHCLKNNIISLEDVNKNIC